MLPSPLSEGATNRKPGPTCAAGPGRNTPSAPCVSTLPCAAPVVWIVGRSAVPCIGLASVPALFVVKLTSGVSTKSSTGSIWMWPVMMKGSVVVPLPVAASSSEGEFCTKIVSDERGGTLMTHGLEGAPVPWSCAPSPANSEQMHVSSAQRQRATTYLLTGTDRCPSSRSSRYWPG